MIVTLSSTFIAGVLIIPYFILLLGANPLMKISFINKYFWPVVESIHAPYKDRYQYWFMARINVLMCIYVIYITLRGRSFSHRVALISVLQMIFLLVQAHINPFEYRLINLLHSWLMLNLSLLYLAIWYAIKIIHILHPLSIFFNHCCHVHDGFYMYLRNLITCGY